MSRFSSVQYGGRVYAKIKKIIVIIMCSKLMLLQRLNRPTLITITLQTYGALVAVHVLSAVVLKD